ncbi:MAG: hypothetical protein ACD_3C00205G0015 [uncultured bacterium (gcode 4)]|uniref:Uncharacterized protein n=1 Tax=uncultured bacterium (gcode 4) TaxID=1234023 RepID=K2FZY1_9BACT|nr:MAG: hypothetical protein ACD_3C00205G0015 [uncultured bacterium (gcode 4)]
MHKPAFIFGNKEIPPEQQDNLTEIRKINSEIVFELLWKKNLTTEDWTAFFEMLNKETSHINSVAEFYENWTYLLLLNFINLSPEKSRDIFLHEIILKAPLYPLMAFCFLNDLNAFRISWIWSIPSVTDAINILTRKNIEFRSYLNI